MKLKKIINDLFFIWIFPILNKNSKNEVIKNKQINYFPNQLLSKNSIINIQIEDIKNKKKSFLYQILLINKYSFIFVFFLNIVQVFLNIYKMSIHRNIIYYFSSDEKILNIKNQLFIYPIIEFITILFNRNNSFFIKKISLRVQMELMNLLYQNIILNKIRNNLSEGEIINLIQGDTNAFYSFLSLCKNLIILPISLLYNLYYLYNSFKLCFVPSICLIGLFSFYLNKKKKIILEKEKNLYLIKDSYMKLVSQTFNSITNIKLLSYEKIIYNKIIERKSKEIKIQDDTSNFYILKNIFFYLSNCLMSLITIITFNIFYKNVNNSLMINAFYSFNELTSIIISIPDIITGNFNIFIPFQRIEKFLEERKINNNIYKQIFNEEDKRTIIIKNMNFGIINNSKEKLLLSNINIKINKGEFIGIIGNVSSGKSNFIKAIINNLDIISKNENDKILINGKFSYVSQIPFLINDTIRNNILFFNEMDYEKYEKIIEICELKEDIELMEKKDFTIIEEKGINLSSGQKSRINIARALYNNSDIYLFDDPLNVLDPIVANKIFKNIFLDYLKGKTILLVTHHIEYIKNSNRVIFFNNGYIEFDGLVNEFYQNEKYKNYQSNIKNENDLFDYDYSFKDNNENKIIDDKNENEIIEDKKNKINFKIALKYFFFYGNIFFIIKYILFKVILKLLNLGEQYYINYWSNLNDISTFQNYKYLSIYLLISIIELIFIFFNSQFIKIGKLKYKMNLHNIILKNLLNTSVNLFHDIVPRGQILNRITNELEQSISLIDTYSDSFEIFLNIFIVIIITIKANYFLILLIPIITLLNWKIFNYYFYPAKNLINLEKETKIKITSTISESLNGISIIKAHNSENNFINIFQERIDTYFKILLIQSGCKSWFKLYIELVSDIFYFCVLFICYYFKNSIPSYIITLLLSYSVKFIDYIFEFFIIIINISHDEKIFERCLEYTNLNNEINIEENNDNEKKEKLFNKGKIIFDNLSIKYRPNTPIVLSNINVIINPNEKIGIVGRTGSGKSTLCLSLFRIIEAFKGKILIDDINIKNINLKQLRKHLTVISQEPFLFEGNLRENIDPYNLHKDKEIKEILEEIKNENLLNDIDLNYQIEDNGKNLSIGEKQIICICRAILNKNKIIILDEVTSNMDYQFELLIQKIFEKEFKNCTTIIVSHRINFLMKCDKIIVFSKGKIIQFDTPKNLINDKNGTFYKLYSLSNS